MVVPTTTTRVRGFNTGADHRWILSNQPGTRGAPNLSIAFWRTKAAHLALVSKNHLLDSPNRTTNYGAIRVPLKETGACGYAKIDCRARLGPDLQPAPFFHPVKDDGNKAFYSNGCPKLVELFVYPDRTVDVLSRPAVLR